MKKYRWVLTAVFVAFLVGTSGCGKKTETIPITTISQSTDDDDPEDNLAASGDSDEIPEYDVDLSKRAKSLKRTETRLPSILPIRTPRQSQWRNA